MLAGLIGLLRGLQRLFLMSRRMESASLKKREIASPAFINIICLYSLLFMSIIFSLLLISVKHFTGGGRYLLPTSGAVMLLIAWGLKNLLPYRWVSSLWCALFGLLALYALFGVLIPDYSLAVQPLIDKPIGFLNDQIALISYTYDKESLTPGDDLKVMIIWQLLKPTSERYSVFVQLLAQGESGEQVVAQVDTYPGLGYYPTCRWKAGRAVRDRYILQLPENLSLSQGYLRLVAGMYKFETMERLAAYQLDQRKRVYQDAFTLGFIRIRGQGGQ